MNSMVFFVVFTLNVLGCFNDPFEFDGNYGDEINRIREYVFEQVVSKEALTRNLNDLQVSQRMTCKNPSNEEIRQYHQKLIQEAAQEDFHRGPSLNELIPSSLIEHLFQKQQELLEDGFSDGDFIDILYFITRYRNQKVFSFFRHNPSDLLGLDKVLRDKATREKRNFELPILSSTEMLQGETAFELKARLLESLFTKEVLKAVKSKDKLKNALEKLDPSFLKQYLGEDADNADLAIFTTPAGQVFFYWLYQSLNLHLICQNEAMISQINKAKKMFENTLGNPTRRAQIFRDRLVAADASIVFTQESDAIIPHLFSKNGFFHPVDAQNPADGTFVFLREDVWVPAYQIIAIDDYEGYEAGRLSVIVATRKDGGEKFLLASSHGNSTRADDGRLQITKIVEKFHQLSKLPENKGLQLVIGIDANTKSAQDVKLLQDLLQSLGLIATSAGPTTIKKRMVTTQHSKAGRFALDEEDYVIVLKPEKGGLYQMTGTTVGFQEEKQDPTSTLPNMDNPSDHYPVGTSLLRAP